ncbi:AAC(3) family N-acetyltransferase [bacterium]|nr:AAC(3) family N-acetyltransferase [bacterium]
MNRKDVTRTDIIQGLRDLGLQEGDKVLLHSSLSSLGRVQGDAETVVDAFLEVLGESGTLVVPTFGDLGIITHAARKRGEAIRSIHPRASVAAIGRDAAEICRDHWKAELAHGEDTPYTRLAEMGGYVCLLGVDQDRNTTLHSAEELLRLPYLKPTSPSTFDTPEGEVTRFWPFFPGPHRDFIRLDRLLRESGKMKIGRIGHAITRLMRSRDLLDIALQAGRLDPAFVLCENPNCPDCVTQRGDLRRDRFEREDSNIATSALLAGRYAEEVAENCLRVGIRWVELDGIDGCPLHTLPPEKIVRTIETIRAAGCDVSALRLSVLVTQAPVARIAAENGIRRLVAPLLGDCAELMRSCQEHDVQTSFFNFGLSRTQVTKQLLNLESMELHPGFTFNGANFARAGENPFLFSYKMKLRRFVDQLDIEDGTFCGLPQPIGRGNAEVKEMISILRASGFQGWMVLSAGNRLTGTFADAADAFEGLLDAM